MNRRRFLQASAAALAAAPSFVHAAAGERPLRVGLIGTGWYGKTDLLHLMQVAPVEVVGLCDVDQRLLEEGAKLVAGRQPSGQSPPTFVDYREFLKSQQPEIVLVGTPDHWHCLPMIDAVRAGADVYVQKPISFDVVEGQAMVAAARKYGRTVQVGLQRRSTPHLQEAYKKYVESGRLGRIASVEIHSYYGPPGEFGAVEPPPAELDWDRYVGPAPWRDYRPGIHPRSWRSCAEFSNGRTGDLCVHFFDAVRMMLRLGWPKSVSAVGGRLMRPDDSTVNVHDTQTATFDYGDTQVVWTQRDWGVPPDPDYLWGATLYGEHGALKLSVHKYDFLPQRGEPEHGDWLDESDKYPEDRAYKPTELFAAAATRAHMRDFLAARAEGRRPVADIGEGHISTACCLLANLSMRLGRSLAYDDEKRAVVGDEEATKLLAREYRQPWVHPKPETV